MLNIVDLGNYPGTVKVNPPPLNLESDKCLVHVAQHLIGSKLFLVLRFIFCDERLGPFALISIGHREGNTNTESVGAAARRNLVDGWSDCEIGDALSVL